MPNLPQKKPVKFFLYACGVFLSMSKYAVKKNKKQKKLSLLPLETESKMIQIIKGLF